jgi:hypothetical protein
VGLFAMLKGLIGGATSPPIATRLTEAEAVALAKEAAGDHWLRNALTVAVAERNADGHGGVDRGDGRSRVVAPIRDQ